MCWILYKANVFTFPRASHPLQLVTFERRYNPLIMVRSLSKCAKIQHFKCWPVNPPRLHSKSMEWKGWSSHCDALMTGITNSNVDFPTLMMLLLGWLTIKKTNWHKEGIILIQGLSQRSVHPSFGRVNSYSYFLQDFFRVFWTFGQC